MNNIYDVDFTAIFHIHLLAFFLVQISIDLFIGEFAFK